MTTIIKARVTIGLFSVCDLGFLTCEHISRREIHFSFISKSSEISGIISLFPLFSTFLPPLLHLTDTYSFSPDNKESLLFFFWSVGCRRRCYIVLTCVLNCRAGSTNRTRLAFVESVEMVPKLPFYEVIFTLESALF